jgi:hypothetical protein
MLERDCENPVEQARAALAGAGVEGDVESVAANLEDVFVASTGFRDGNRDAGSAA